MYIKCCTFLYIMGQCVTINVGNIAPEEASSGASNSVTVGEEEEEDENEEEENEECLASCLKGCVFCV